MRIWSGIFFGGIITATALTIVAAPEKLLEIQWNYSGRPSRVNTSEAAEIIGNDVITREIADRLRPGEILASSSYT